MVIQKDKKWWLSEFLILGKLNSDMEYKMFPADLEDNKIYLLKRKTGLHLKTDVQPFR